MIKLSGVFVKMEDEKKKPWKNMIQHGNENSSQIAYSICKIYAQCQHS